MVKQINLLTTLVISFLSIYIGLILAYLSKLEVKPALKYIRVIKNSLFSGILGTFAYFVNPYAAFIAAPIFMLLLFFNLSNRILFPLTAFIFYYASTLTLQSFELVATLIYLLGLTIGVIFFANNEKLNLKKMLGKLFIEYVWFLVIGIILILL
ncbi:hypothetical protein DRJ17_00435 [Candidatus Woesearchaeota archaeon]|nr:MAG: hypothetical protein DRJ17_00435 [Candidatus Woesearchaeota archaeon]